MVGSDSRVSQAVLSKLQNAVPRPCGPTAGPLAQGNTQSFGYGVPAGRDKRRIWELRCPHCARPRCRDGCSALGLPAQALGSHSLGFSFAFGCHPRRKTPNWGRCKEWSRMRGIPPLPHAGAEWSMEVPRAFANLASREPRFSHPGEDGSDFAAGGLSRSRFRPSVSAGEGVIAQLARRQETHAGSCGKLLVSSLRQTPASVWGLCWAGGNRVADAAARWLEKASCKAALMLWRRAERNACLAAGWGGWQ